MESLDGPSSAEEAGTCLASLPTDLQKSILSRVSTLSGGYSHAVVSREWAELAPSAQLSCVMTCKAAWEEPAGGVQPNKFAQTLSDFPNLTSLHLTATNCSALPDSLLPVPESLQHLWIRNRGPPGSWPPLLLQGLPRFMTLENLSVLGQGLPEVAWPLSASLRILELGGWGKGLHDRLPENSSLLSGSAEARWGGACFLRRSCCALES